jgi:hypothetical protein
LIRRILEHNQLNGVIFATLEFILVAAAAAYIALAFAVQHKPIFVVLAAGTALNSLVIVGYGAAAWSRGELGTSITRLFDARHRAEVSRSHPQLMADTVIVAAAALLPYVLLVTVAIELVRARRVGG